MEKLILGLLHDQLFRIKYLYILFIVFGGKQIKQVMFLIRVMIFGHPFDDNFLDNLVFLSSYWSKTMEREKGKERIRVTCEYEIESCSKVVKKWLYKYHFSIHKKQRNCGRQMI